MDTALVVEAIERSISGPRVTDAAPIKPHGLGDQLLVNFNAHRIVPREFDILTNAQQLGSAAPETLTVFLLTIGDPQSVFYDPVTGQFGVAWGPDAETGSYFDEGFRSSDVLHAQFISE